MAKSIRKFFSNNLIFALASIVIGIVMLIMRGGLLHLLVQVIAVVFIVYGAFEIIR